MTEEKLPVYFIIEEDKPTYDSILKMHYEINKRFFDYDKFQPIIILNIDQKMNLFQSIRIMLFMNQNIDEIEYAGFKIKTLIGRLE